MTESTQADLNCGPTRSRSWGEEKFLDGGNLGLPVVLEDAQVSSESEALEIVVPAEMTTDNPETLVIEWGNAR